MPLRREAASPDRAQRTETAALAGKVALALVVAGLGAGLLHLVSFPAASLSGAAIAVAAAAVAGLPVALPRLFRQASYVVLGAGMGAAVTPDAFDSLARWPLALVFLFASLFAVTAASVLVLRRFGGFDTPTAFCAAIPGALSQVMATAIDAGVDVPRVALAQSLRLLVLVALLPAIATLLGGAQPAGENDLPPVAGAGATVLMLGAGTLAGVLAMRLRVPAGLLLGAFATSAVLHGSGVLVSRLPALVMEPAFLLLGAAIGAAFAGSDRKTLLHTLRTSAAALAAALAIAVAAALSYAGLFGAPFGEVMLAFAPGGIEAMITLAFLLGYDVPFVAALHVIRLVFLLVALPLMLRLVMRATGRAGAAREG